MIFPKPCLMKTLLTALQARKVPLTLMAMTWSKASAGNSSAGNRLAMPATVTVRARVGGEKLKPEAHARTLSVQHLCQVHGVLPWLRDALPMVFADDALIAVADLWVDAHWRAAHDAPGYGLVWQSAPIIV